MTDLSYRSFSGSGAASYQRHFVPAIAAPVSACLLAATDLRSGERVLDVACGTGVIARLAAEAVGADGGVVAIDLAADMIAVAEATPRPAGATIEWHVGDATSLPFDDEQFDVVTCQMGLMFMEDRAGAVAEMRRVLVSDGRVVVSTPGTIQPPFALMEDAIVEHISADLGGFVRAVFSMHDPAEVATLLGAAGLVDVVAEVSPAMLGLPMPAEFLWQYISLTPMAPFVARAPEAAQVAMERQVVESWAPFVVDGGVPVEQPMVVARGRR